MVENHEAWSHEEVDRVLHFMWMKHITYYILQTDVNQAYITHTACGEICKEWSLKKITRMEV